MKVLMTGYSGFIGNKLIHYLSKKKYIIKILGRKKFYNYTFHKCDFLYEKIPQSICKDIDTVFHIAGIAHQKYKQKDKFKFEKKILKINLNATKELAQDAKKNNVKKFIFISSAKSLNKEFNNLTYDQVLNLKTNNIYDKSKKLAEMALKKIFDNQSMTKLIIIRPTLVYGPEAKGNIKTLHNFLSFFPFLIIPKINNHRSMIHIDNLVESIFFISNLNNYLITIYTLADDRPYSFSEIITQMKKNINIYIYEFFLPSVFIKMLLKFDFSKKKNLSKIFGDEVYIVSELSEIGYTNKMNINNFYETYI